MIRKKHAIVTIGLALGFVFFANMASATTDSAALVAAKAGSLLQAVSDQVTAEKLYTDTKNGFSVTLPSGWTKGKNTSPDTLFSATKGTTTQWQLSFVKLSSQKEADQFQTMLVTQPAKLTKQVLAELQKQFPDCTTKSAKKRTLGKFTGSQGVFLCTIEKKSYQLGFFSFVRSRTQYTAVALALSSQYSALAASFDAITKSLAFTK